MNVKKLTAAAAAAVLLVSNIGYTSSSYSSNIPNSYAAGSFTASSYSKNTEGFVTRMYNIVLGRKPDTNGLNTWVNRLNTKKATAADIVSGFFNSDEYKKKKKTNEQILTDCYNAMLGREPDASGMKSWMQKLNVGMTLAVVYKGFVGSNEFRGLCSTYGITPGSITLKYARDENYNRTYFVYRLYKNCLSREPDTNGLETWCQRLKNGYTGSQIAKGFIFSKEYKSKNTSNADFVKMLYRTILGREPDQSGYNSWLNKLNNGTSRESVTNGFIFSNEFRAQCTKIGIQLGDKIQIPEETLPNMNQRNEILTLVNKERASRGLSPLTLNTELCKAADIRSKEIASYFSHTRPDGTICYTVLNGVNLPVYYHMGENIASGYTSASAVMTGWMNSQPHRENILSTDYKYIGIGVVNVNGRYHWTQLFIG
ncbi:MAG: DUF4214 domain-containing protein [Ruminococcus sp.]|nr:DUF4214 domain-containing protein [Ruminococcus sp.]